MGADQSRQGKDPPVPNTTATKMNPRKRTNEEAFSEHYVLPSEAQPMKRPTLPRIQRLELATGVKRSNPRRADEPEPLPNGIYEFTPQRSGRIDVGREDEVADLNQQLTTSQAQLQEAYEDHEKYWAELKYETDFADRLTKENKDLKRKLQNADIEIGELHGRTQEAEIKCERLVAENEGLTQDLQEAEFRVDAAEARTIMLEKQLQDEEDRGDQFEAANLDLRRELQDAQGRVAMLEMNAGDRPEGIGFKSQEDMADLEDEAMLASKSIADLERQPRVAGDQRRGLQGQLEESQDKLQNREQHHLAYENPLGNGFGTAQEVIEHLQALVKEKEDIIRRLQSREHKIFTENARLDTKNTELKTRNEKLELIIENRERLINDELTGLENNCDRWQEKIERNAATERKLRKENENLREQIWAFEDQIQEMMDELMLSDDEEEVLDLQSISSATEPGSYSYQLEDEDEDEENGPDMPNDSERYHIDAPGFLDVEDGSNVDGDGDSEDIADIKCFIAHVATLYQKELVTWNNLNAGKITPESYERQQAEVKLEFDAIELTQSQEHAFKEWSSLREDIEATEDREIDDLSE